MLNRKLLSLSVLCAVAGAFAAPNPVEARALSLKKGVYRCELKRSVRVNHVSTDRRVAKIQWGHRAYTLRAVHARSGALRYEDKASGLMWLTVVGKSMLLDTKRGRQLANECRAS
ncbi:MAG: MliC family protein [Burkholderiaceae bacterium]